jgi:hypothetical protein
MRQFLKRGSLVVLLALGTFVLIVQFQNCVKQPPPFDMGANGTFGSTQGYGLYSCPLMASTSCSNASLCESTCLGQYTPNATCTYYTQNAVPNTVMCSPVNSMQGAYSCPSQLSQPCGSMDVCESTCVGQIQANGNCTPKSGGGVGEYASCSPEAGNTIPVYLCPTTPSTNCTVASSCQSSCVGQYTTASFCTYYQGASPVSEGCNLIGNYSF